MNRPTLITRMLEMYNRRVDDQTLKNYLSVTENYSDEEVGASIKNLIAQFDNLPNPRALAKDLHLSTKVDRQGKAICEICGSKGWVRIEDDVDLSGLQNYEYGKNERCKMRCNLGPNHPPLMTREDVRIGAFARILASIIAKRALDGEVLKTVPDWGRYSWDLALYDKLREVVEPLGFSQLQVAEREAINLDVGLCQTAPEEAASKLVELVKGQEAPSLFKSI